MAYSFALQELWLDKVSMSDYHTDRCYYTCLEN